MLIFLYNFQLRSDVHGFANNVKREVFIRANKDVFRLKNQSSSKFNLNEYSLENLLASDNFSNNFGKSICFLAM